MIIVVVVLYRKIIVVVVLFRKIIVVAAISVVIVDLVRKTVVVLGMWWFVGFGNVIIKHFHYLDENYLLDSFDFDHTYRPIVYLEFLKQRCLNLGLHFIKDW